MFVPSSQCDDIWRWELWALDEVLMMGLVHLYEDTPERLLFLLPHAQRSCVNTRQDGSPLRAQSRGLRMQPPLLAPPSWTSQPPDGGK